MNSPPESSAIQRYVPPGIHNDCVMAGAMNSSQERVICPSRVEMSHFRNWSAGNLQTGKAVVIAPPGSRTVAADVGRGSPNRRGAGENHMEDITRLLQLLVAGIVPDGRAPPVHVREWRSMIAYRNRRYSAVCRPKPMKIVAFAHILSDAKMIVLLRGVITPSSEVFRFTVLSATARRRVQKTGANGTMCMGRVNVGAPTRRCFDKNNNINERTSTTYDI